LAAWIALVVSLAALAVAHTQSQLVLTVSPIAAVTTEVSAS
jgi:hypothetical protein